MAITSMNDVLNETAVMNACDKIRQGADFYEKAGDFLSEAYRECTDDALSVDGKSMQKYISDIMVSIQDVKKELYNFCSSVEGAARTIYNDQITELNEYNNKSQDSQ